MTHTQTKAIAQARRTIANLETDWRAAKNVKSSLGRKLIAARRRLRELEGAK